MTTKILTPWDEWALILLSSLAFIGVIFGNTASSTCSRYHGVWQKQGAWGVLGVVVAARKIIDFRVGWDSEIFAMSAYMMQT